MTYRRGFGRMAFVAVAAVAISLGTLLATSVAYATGHDPAGLCGGG
jgi:ketol-acid reductoisomerase